MADSARTDDPPRDLERSEPAQRQAAPQQPKARASRSIPGRIFAGFTVVLLAFGTLAAASVWQHQRTAQTLRL